MTSLISGGGSLADSNPKMPLLDFGVGDSFSDSAVMSLTSVPGDRGLLSPPYVTAFSVNRRVRNFSGASWQLSVYDPNHEMFEELVYRFSEETLFGSVVYSFGYADASGAQKKTPPISGMCLSAIPSYRSRSGMQLQLSGISFDLESAVRRVRIDTLKAIISSVEANPGQWTLGSFLSSLLTSSTTQVDVVFEPEALESQITMQGWTAFAGDDSTNWSGLYSHLPIGSMMVAAPAEDVSVGTLLNIVQYYCYSVLGGDNVAVVIDTPESSNRLVLKVKSKLAYASDGSDSTESGRDFYLFTTQLNDGSANTSDVSDFVPKLDALTPAMFGLTDYTAQSREAYSRAPQTLDSRLHESMLGPSLGESQMSFLGRGSSGVDVGLGTYLRRNAEDMGVVLPGATPPGTDIASIELARETIRSRMAYMPITASMTVQFPDPGIEPWSYINVHVLTPKGESPMVSGKYCVRGTSYSASPGRFSGTFDVMKSGPLALAGVTRPLSVSTQMHDSSGQFSQEFSQ